MSGVGSKAGGPDYLLQFMEPRVVTENTVRARFRSGRRAGEGRLAHRAYRKKSGCLRFSKTAPTRSRISRTPWSAASSPGS